MKIPNIFKPILRQFVDVDHSVFDNHKRFSIKYNKDILILEFRILEYIRIKYLSGIITVP